MTEIQAYLKTESQLVEAELLKYLTKDGPAPRLCEAMRYAVMNGGKRIRPILMLAVADVLGLDRQQILPIACALEMIHSYSLVHDDLPAMDNDDLRRGKPTTHKQFDEATAILAGDTLQCYAFKVIAQGCREGGVSADRILLAAEALATASGALGMAGGQMLDLQNEGKLISLEELKKMHSLKTGALLEYAVAAPLFIVQPQAEIVDGLMAYAAAIGLAFQIKDDILDVEASTEALGKTAGKDQDQHKSTFVSLLGLAGAKAELALETQKAYAAVQKIDTTGKLTELAQYLLERNA